MTLRIHHATAKKAELAGVTLTIDGDRVVAIDALLDPDHEFAGSDAAQLLASVLARRPAKPNKTRAGKDEDEDEDEGEGKGDEELIDDVAEEESESGGDAEDEDGEPDAGTIVKPKYKALYSEFDDTCGDAFAEALSRAGRTKDGALDLDACRQIAEDNGIADRWDAWTARPLNPGQRRMCLGNVLRGMVRKAGTVVIGRQTFEGVRGEDGEVTVRTSKPRGAVL